MKYLHIITLEKFTKGFIEFISENFDANEHAFVVYGSIDRIKRIYPCLDLQIPYENVRYIANHHFIRKDKTISKWIRESKLIIINGMFGAEKCLIHYFPTILKKTYLLFWGGDFRYTPNTDRKFSKEQLFRIYRKHLIQNVAGVITIIDKDYDILCDVAQPKGKHFVAPIISNGDEMKLVQQYFCYPKGNDPTIIQIGNSANKGNEHLQIFEMLAKYKNQNIQVICPLAYGRESYRQKVVDEGRRIFGDKFIPLLEFMPMDAYYKLLSNVDVAIFNYTKQHALGNISACLGLGAKVYLQSDTGMWFHYAEQLHYHVYDVAKLKKADFQSFVEYDEQTAKENHKAFLQAMDPKVSILAWQRVFDSVDA